MEYPHLQSINAKRLRKLLVKSILLEPERSRMAFDEWERLVVFDDLDFESFKLLPAVHHKTHSNDATRPLSLRIKSAYRRTWTENQILLTNLRDLFESLAAGAIWIIIADETLQLAEIRNDIGIYSLANFGLMAPISRKKEFLQILIENSWDTENDGIEITRCKKDRTSHINVLWLSDFDFDSRMKTSESILVKDCAQSILSAEEQVLNLCAREFSISGDENSHWQFVIFELFNAQKIDPDRLTLLARKRWLSNKLAHMLQILIDDFEAKIPFELVEGLRKCPKASKAVSIRRKIRNLRESYQMFQEYGDQTGSKARFLEFLAERWKTDSNIVLIKHAVKSGLRLFQTG